MTLPALAILWLSWQSPDVRIEVRATPVLAMRGPRVVSVQAQEIEVAVVWTHW